MILLQEQNLWAFKGVLSIGINTNANDYICRESTYATPSELLIYI